MLGRIEAERHRAQALVMGGVIVVPLALVVRLVGGILFLVVVLSIVAVGRGSTSLLRVHGVHITLLIKVELGGSESRREVTGTGRNRYAAAIVRRGLKTGGGLGIGVVTRERGRSGGGKGVLLGGVMDAVGDQVTLLTRCCLLWMVVWLAHTERPGILPLDVLLKVHNLLIVIGVVLWLTARWRKLLQKFLLNGFLLSSPMLLQGKTLLGKLLLSEVLAEAILLLMIPMLVLNPLQANLLWAILLLERLLGTILLLSKLVLALNVLAKLLLAKLLVALSIWVMKVFALPGLGRLLLARQRVTEWLLDVMMLALQRLASYLAAMESLGRLLLDMRIRSKMLLSVQRPVGLLLEALLGAQPLLLTQSLMMRPVHDKAATAGCLGV